MKRLTVAECLRDLADEYSRRREQILKRGILFDLLNESVEEWERRYPEDTARSYVSCPTTPFSVDAVMVALHMTPENVLADVFMFVSGLRDRITAFGYQVDFIQNKISFDYMLQEWNTAVSNGGKFLFNISVRVFPSYMPNARCKRIQTGTREEPIYETKCVSEAAEGRAERYE